MDTLAHGLWGGVAFGRDSRRDYGLAFLLGAGPDLVSFGPAFVKWTITGFPPRHHGGPPDDSAIPHFVHAAYNVSHSAVMWAAVFLLLWLWLRRPPWVFCAWLLHILCDIPTHSTRFFPTPYLWPFPTPFVNGIPWARPPLMIANYSALTLAYLSWYFVRRSRKPA
jgi:hypothetical protein